MTHICPICKNPTNSETDEEFPFCSKRCRTLDLGAWATDKYKISNPAFGEGESVPDKGEDDE